MAAILAERRQSLRKKILRGKNFEFRDFRLKHSESIPTKIFWLCNFFTILAIMAEKRQSLRKKIYTGKIFDFEIFCLKPILEHSESIPTKKFSIKISWVIHFFTILVILAEKRESQTKHLTREKFSISRIWFKIRFETFWIDSDQKNYDPNFLTLSFFHYFGHFGRKTTDSQEKNFTREKFFDFEIFFCLKPVLEHSESAMTSSYAHHQHPVPWTGQPH